MPLALSLSFPRDFQAANPINLLLPALFAEAHIGSAQLVTLIPLSLTPLPSSLSIQAQERMSAHSSRFFLLQHQQSTALQAKAKLSCCHYLRRRLTETRVCLIRWRARVEIEKSWHESSSRERDVSSHPSYLQMSVSEGKRREA